VNTNYLLKIKSILIGGILNQIRLMKWKLLSAWTGQPIYKQTHAFFGLLSHSILDVSNNMYGLWSTGRSNVYSPGDTGFI